MLRKVWRIGMFVVVGLVACAIVLAGGALAYRGYRQHQNARAFAITAPAGIQEGRFVKIGGIEQWVQIRGDDIDNPVLLVLHGGPGAAYSPATPIFLAWEKYFTVVQWDQRGAGLTFGRNGEQGSGEMSIDRMTQDGIEVAEYLRQRLHKDKILIYGTSWGTVLGVEMAKRRPDLFLAYVGSGQLVDELRTEQMGYQTCLEAVRRAGDAEGLAALTAAGPPPYRSLEQLGVERRLYYRYAPMAPDEKSFSSKILWTVLFAPEYRLRDIFDYNDGAEFSMRAIFAEGWGGDGLDLRRLGPRFEVPVVIIQGADDTLTPVSLAREYFDSIEAPHKELILLPGAGHMVSLAQPDRMLREFLIHVRPLAGGPVPTAY